MLALVLLLGMAYGSLYPFAFRSLPAGPAGDPAAVGADDRGLLDRLGVTALARGRPSRGDALANLLFYMPFGAALALAAPAPAGRLAAAVSRLAVALVGAAALACSLELLQLRVVGRVGSVTDVGLNVGGALAGAVAALGASSRTRDRDLDATPPAASWARLWPAPRPFPLSLIAAWLGWRLMPFVPVIDWQKYKDALKPLVLHPHISVTGVARYLAAWLIVAEASRLLWPRRSGWAQVAALAIVGIALGVGRLVVVGLALEASELAALVLAAPLTLLVGRLARGGGAAERGGLALLAAIVLAAVVANGLGFPVSPLAAEPASFLWTPLRGLLDSGPEHAAIVLCEKAFLYGGAVWLAARALGGVARGGLLVAAVLVAIEVAQRWLPGRIPEVTDPLLALSLAALLAWTEPGGGRASCRDTESAADPPDAGMVRQ